ncbi:hypothetical protein L873DRAFT_1806582 [Choiromyces venosus 120613-1]|uniref:Uncharacterized protein n=1 Tax=Choiromyces venosus 120613-1 TaxID=1336337 RepID=A0A3N4K0G8_9PEZI|nr:hypothetical protein L873DRAFT_1806582 [Choiromyces venosus 120613-1]
MTSLFLFSCIFNQFEGGKTVHDQGMTLPFVLGMTDDHSILLSKDVLLPYVPNVSNSYVIFFSFSPFRRLFLLFL